MTPPRFVLRLGKEDFKFSVAHFTVFSDRIAEDLHGHNYRVRVEIAGNGTDAHGLLMDLRGVKAEIRRLCAELDSKTLLPERSRAGAVSPPWTAATRCATARASTGCPRPT